MGGKMLQPSRKMFPKKLNKKRGSRVGQWPKDSKREWLGDENRAVDLPGVTPPRVFAHVKCTCFPGMCVWRCFMIGVSWGNRQNSAWWWRFFWWAKESRWILLSCCWCFELLCFTSIQPTTLDGQLKNSCWLFCYSCYHLEHLSARVVSINITPSCRQIPPQLLTSLRIFSSSKKPSVLKFGCWVEYITVKNRCQNQDVCVFAGTLVPEKILFQIRQHDPNLSPTNYLLGCFPIDAETSRRLGLHFSG